MNDPISSLLNIRLRQPNSTQETYHLNSTRAITEARVLLIKQNLNSVLTGEDSQVATTLKPATIRNHTVGIHEPANKDIIQNCIFLAFFLSLVVLCGIILKKTFNYKRMNSGPNQTRSLHNHRNGCRRRRRKGHIYVQNTVSNQSLDYFYQEPRRILWEAYYGRSQLISFQGSEVILRVVNDIETLPPAYISNGRKLDNSPSPNRHCMSLPPTYAEAIKLSRPKHIYYKGSKKLYNPENENSGILPSYSEAITMGSSCYVSNLK